MFFILMLLAALFLAIGSIYAYSASLYLLTPWKRIGLGLAVTILFFGTFLLSRISEPHFILTTVYFFAWIFGGTILYSMILIPILGIITFIGWRLKKPNIRITGTWIILTIAFGVSVFGIYQRTWIKTTSYTLETSRPELTGKTFAVIADPQFNIANNKNFARRITKKLSTLKYDALLMPGDVFDGATLDWEPLETEFKKWSDMSPVFMAPGNHEEYGDYNVFMNLMKNNGIVTLEDQQVIWNGITIAGFKYYGKAKEVQGTQTITSLLNTHDPKNPLIVINHEPRYMELFANSSADLVVYGHTHGGQFWPLKYIVKQVYGNFWYGKNTVGDTTLITSSGLGLAAFPSRLFNTPEIVLVTFVAK